MPTIDWSWSVSLGAVLNFLGLIAVGIFTAGKVYENIQKKLNVGRDARATDRTVSDFNFESLFLAIGDARRESRESIQNLREDSIEAHNRLRKDLTDLGQKVAVITYKLDQMNGGGH